MLSGHGKGTKDSSLENDLTKEIGFTAWKKAIQGRLYQKNYKDVPSREARGKSMGREANGPLNTF